MLETIVEAPRRHLARAFGESARAAERSSARAAPIREYSTAARRRPRSTTVAPLAAPTARTLSARRSIASCDAAPASCCVSICTWSSSSLQTARATRLADVSAEPAVMRQLASPRRRSLANCVSSGAIQRRSRDAQRKRSKTVELAARTRARSRETCRDSRVSRVTRIFLRVAAHLRDARHLLGRRHTQSRRDGRELVPARDRVAGSCARDTASSTASSAM